MNKKHLTTHKIVKQEIQTLSIETSLQDAESQQCLTHKIVKQEIQTLSIETSLQDAESQQCLTHYK